MHFKNHALKIRITVDNDLELVEDGICFNRNFFPREFVEVKKMKRKYTAIVRKSKLEYVAICLELNVSACGDDLVSVEKNLRNAIELYLEDIKENSDTKVSPIPTEEFIEFLKDTEPEWYKEAGDEFILRPLEIHEVPSYA